MRTNPVRWLLLAVCVLSGTAHADSRAPFLWEVQGPEARHYLLGSLHLLPDSAYPLPDALTAAYAATRHLVLETDPAALASAEFQTRMLSAALDPRPGGIKAQIGAPLYERLQKQAQVLGLPGSVCDTFRAWLCATTLELYPMLRAGWDPQHGLDQHFYDKARRDGRVISWLESPDQQLTMLTGMPDALS
ncbi:MAG: TraB/GumN family protein, partial [Nevskiales bacterium]|nr:TraB/GumN family protein [Nevskiales bacterium]